MYNQNYLTHYGVLGMKWGKRNTQNKSYISTRKANEKAYRTKLTNITKNKNINDDDRKRFEYRKQNLATRIGKTASAAIVGMVITDIFTGQIANYKNMDSYQIKKKIASVAFNTASNVAIKDALAKSAAKRYNDDGGKIRGKKIGWFTKEEKIEMGLKVARKIAPIAAFTLHVAAAEARRKRAVNEAAFAKWGAKILSDKVSDYISAEYSVR